MKFFPHIVAICFMLSVTNANAVAFHTKDADRNAGDIIQLAVPLVGLGLTWLKDDPEGRKPWAYTMFGTIASTGLLKKATDGTSLGERPNGGRFSFPSGHTSSACAGAVFMGRRYGWNYGIPALAASGFVAYSRVDEDLHHWRDVIAGCALGASFSYFLVQPRNQNLTVMPTWDDTGLSLSAVMQF